jgi:hypothetical protein
MSLRLDWIVFPVEDLDPIWISYLYGALAPVAPGMTTTTPRKVLAGDLSEATI